METEARLQALVAAIEQDTVVPLSVATSEALRLARRHLSGLEHERELTAWYDARYPEHAPDHLVRMLAALLPERRSPTRTADQERVAALAQARLTVDTIWRVAHLAGQVYAASMRPPPPMFLCDACPNKEKVLAAFSWPATGVPGAEEVVRMTAKKDDPTAEANRLRAQAKDLRAQGDHEGAQRAEQQAVTLEQQGSTGDTKSS